MLLGARLTWCAALFAEAAGVLALAGGKQEAQEARKLQHIALGYATSQRAEHLYALATGASPMLEDPASVVENVWVLGASMQVEAETKAEDGGGGGGGGGGGTRGGVHSHTAALFKEAIATFSNADEQLMYEERWDCLLSRGEAHAAAHRVLEVVLNII